MKNRILLIALPALLLGCELEERPAYTVAENTLPAGGPTIQYRSGDGFTNIEQVRQPLSEAGAEKFDSSLAWYGTESSFSLEKLHGKTAKQTVDVVNCLKTANIKAEQSECFQ